MAQAFDGGKFNFTKALQKEVLCQFEGNLDRFPAFTQEVITSCSPHMSAVLVDVAMPVVNVGTLLQAYMWVL